MSAHLFSRQLLALFCVIVLSACDGSSTVVVSSANNIIGNADTVENPINNDASNGGGDGTSDTNSSLNIDTNADDGDGNNGGASGDSSAGNPIADDDSTTNLESNANPGSTDQTGSSNLTPVNDPAGELEPEPATEPEPEPEPVIDPLTLGSFELRLDATRFELIEANENGVTVPINISRIDGHVRPVRITVSPDSELDSRRLDVQFDNNELERDETFTSWRAELGVAMGPLVFHERTFTVTADDGREQFSANPSRWTFARYPRPMFTCSSARAIWRAAANWVLGTPARVACRRTEPAHSSAQRPAERSQLCSTNRFCSSTRASTPWTRDSSPPKTHCMSRASLSAATRKARSSASALSFAKGMLPNTSTDIVLVPAAWSGRGLLRQR